jgi:hypothetical protein
MLTLQQLSALTLNAEVVKEAYAQAEKRLTDALDAKKVFEEKATIFLNAFVTLAVALFSGGAAFFQNGDTAAGGALAFAAVLMSLGAILFAYVLRPDEYGMLGSDPSMWLNAGTIDGPATATTQMLAYIVFYHSDRIAVSTDNNTRKAKYLQIGIELGISAPFALALIYLLLRAL